MHVCFSGIRDVGTHEWLGYLEHTANRRDSLPPRIQVSLLRRIARFLSMYSFGGNKNIHVYAFTLKNPLQACASKQLTIGAGEHNGFRDKWPQTGQVSQAKHEHEQANMNMNKQTCKDPSNLFVQYLCAMYVPLQWNLSELCTIYVPYGWLLVPFFSRTHEWWSQVTERCVIKHAL